MNLDPSINYIVSGVERSGTSLLMQALYNGGAPVGFDDSRKPDPNNPKGYYELEGGKIINKLMDGSFPLDRFKGQFIKITSYGLQFLPPGNYKIIYSERNMEEILDSMEKMAQITDENRQETKEVFTKLNTVMKQKMTEREDIKLLLVNYNTILEQPDQEFTRIYEFIGQPDLNVSQMIGTVDTRLYRQRRT